MFDYKTNDSAALTRELGIWLTPGVGKAYPELKEMLMKLYRDKVSKLNFVPFGWLSAVMAVNEAHPDDLVRIGSAVNAGGDLIIQGNADFVVQSRETAEAWQAIFDITNKVIATYAQKQQQAAAAQLDQLYRNATFWNRAYLLADSIVSAPGRLTNNLMDSLSNPVKVVMYGAIVLAIVYCTYQVAGPVIRAKYTK